MNLTTSIELNKQSEKSLRDHKFIDHADAIKLGIEALKRELFKRQTMSLNESDFLPGETEE